MKHYLEHYMPIFRALVKALNKYFLSIIHWTLTLTHSSSLPSFAFLLFLFIYLFLFLFLYPVFPKGLRLSRGFPATASIKLILNDEYISLRGLYQGRTQDVT